MTTGNAVAFTAAFAVMTGAIEHVRMIPHGAWDGWAIWNSHARYLYHDASSWTEHIQNSFHGDYPLLLPVNVVRLWRYAGAEVPDLGGIFGLLMALSGVAILGAVLSSSRRTSVGLVVTLVLMTTPSLFIQAGDQEADVPLSVFFLASIALLCVSFEEERVRWGALALSGFLAGSAGPPLDAATRVADQLAGYFSAQFGTGWRSVSRQAPHILHPRASRR
jgi:hypothetical protein